MNYYVKNFKTEKIKNVGNFNDFKNKNLIKQVL